MRPAPSLAPPVDAVSAFPDVVGESFVPPHAGAQPAPLQTEPPALLEDPPTLFDEVTSEHAEYKLPDAGRPPHLAGAGRRLGRDRGARRRAARADARAFRRRGHGDRPDLGPARYAIRAPACAGDEGREGRGAQGRPLVRARDDRDPDPRADPRQAGGRASSCRTSPRTSSRSATSSSRSRRPRARSPSGSARTSPAPPSGPTSRACRTC